MADEVEGIPAELILAKIGGKWQRVEGLELLEAGTETLTGEDLSEDGDVTKAYLTKVYSEMTATETKNWKTRKLVAESIVSQAAKLELFVPAAEKIPSTEEDLGAQGTEALAVDAKKSGKKRQYKKTDGWVVLLTDEQSPNRAQAVKNLAKQAQVTVTVLLKLAEQLNVNQFKRSEVEQAMRDAKESGLLVTKQPGERIFAYYTARLIKAGVIVMPMPTPEAK